MPAPRGPGPLLIVCALGIERLALLGGGSRSGGARNGAVRSDEVPNGAVRNGGAPASADPGAPPGPVTVLRTGMGPRNAERAVRAALDDDGMRNAAVIASGFCAGLAGGMRPGDLVVAAETRHLDGVTVCTDPERLAAALSRALPGRRVHTGPLTGADHVVRGRERALLRTTGAIAADMESAATLLTALRAGPRPIAAVRVIVDAPEHELVRLGTVRGGISAFRVLRSVLPAFHEWHRSLLLPWR
ncbi:1-hydroxy-2-methyl-2-butenyl 4-diphosphate reductase [Streptomyces sp. NPDC014894]|uniref:phosphorylase family protein n=1 Tax=Streptomyces sp. NPDC014894 TaxID=3364931 RepID=UPI0036FB9441